MEISIAGTILATLIAFLCLFGRRTTIIASICAFAFPSTAIFTLSSLGGSSITVPQFGLVCLTFAALISGDLGHKISNIYKTESSVQIISLFAIFAVCGAFIMPRLFQDVTEVFSLARGAGGKGNILSTVPLAFTSGNITQPFYFIGNTLGFISVLVLCQTTKVMEDFFAGLVCLALVHITGGGIDFVSKYGVGYDLLDFLRTAKYAMLIDVDVLNFKRIVGLYPEASAFAYGSICFTAFTFGAWRILGLRGGVFIFFGVLTCLLVSTSSTAYFCIAILTVLYILNIIIQILRGEIEELAIILFICLIIVLIVGLTIVITVPKTLDPFQDLLQRMVLNKADSESARQRFGWNMQAVKNVIETGGIGAGLGSLRSSSWPLTLAAEMGFIGIFTYGFFVFTLFFTPGAPPHRSSPRLRGIASSCQLLLVASLVAASASSALFDLGATFYITAGCIIAAKRLDRGDTLYQRWNNRQMKAASADDPVPA